ncbi:MAG TPA: ABC transporter ATP-binding protein [Burkholderiales bacterium]|nr:ABC transporter ATP-binding protein [Burkholderiales bacterium]
MIALDDVHKRYWTNRGEAVWALRGVSATFPARRNVAVIGATGAGKSTLLRLIAGIDQPTRGSIASDRRVSWPIGQTRGLQPNLTGRQNARFVCRIQGIGEERVGERVNFVHEFSELGEAFDQPVSSYSKGMRARLNFALSVAFDFDVYLVDENMGAGGGEDFFREKTRNAMKYLARRADLIIATHSERLVRSFCQSALWLCEGRGYWFDSADEAWREHARQVAA